MNSFLIAILAFIVAYSVTLIERVTSHHPRTYQFILTSVSLHIYAIIYGLIGTFIFVSVSILQTEDLLTIKGLGLSNQFWLAFLIGLSTKGFLGIRLFTVNDGSSSFPVGLESLVQLFEPWCIENLDLHEFNSIRSYIESKSEGFLKGKEKAEIQPEKALADVKFLIEKNMPRKWSYQKKGAFKIDLEEKETMIEAMELFLYEAGKETFERVFK